VCSGTGVKEGARGVIVGKSDSIEFSFSFSVEEKRKTKLVVFSDIQK
jgi:hypothetical protein